MVDICSVFSFRWVVARAFFHGHVGIVIFEGLHSEGEGRGMWKGKEREWMDMRGDTPHCCR